MPPWRGGGGAGSARPCTPAEPAEWRMQPWRGRGGGGSNGGPRAGGRGGWGQRWSAWARPPHASTGRAGRRRGHGRRGSPGGRDAPCAPKGRSGGTPTGTPLPPLRTVSQVQARNVPALRQSHFDGPRRGPDLGRARTAPDTGTAARPAATRRRIAARTPVGCTRRAPCSAMQAQRQLARAHLRVDYASGPPHGPASSIRTTGAHC